MAPTHLAIVVGKPVEHQVLILSSGAGGAAGETPGQLQINMVMMMMTMVIIMMMMMVMMMMMMAIFVTALRNQLQQL